MKKTILFISLILTGFSAVCAEPAIDYELLRKEVVRQIQSSGSGKCTSGVILTLMGNKMALGLHPKAFYSYHMDNGKTTAYDVEMVDPQGKVVREYSDSALIHCEDLHG